MAAREQRYKIEDPLKAKQVGALVAGLSIEHHPWEVVVRKWVKKRTLPQNALYWKWLEIIGAETGNDKDDLHDAFREKFLPWTEVEVCGVRKKILTSTSSKDFKTADMSAYMSNIERFAAADLGILLPRPEDAAYEDYAR